MIDFESSWDDTLVRAASFRGRKRLTTPLKIAFDLGFAMCRISRLGLNATPPNDAVRFPLRELGGCSII
jgi:hypothetical protein